MFLDKRRVPDELSVVKLIKEHGMDYAESCEYAISLGANKIMLNGWLNYWQIGKGFNDTYLEYL